jgi:hypothetical protein
VLDLSNLGNLRPVTPRRTLQERPGKRAINIALPQHGNYASNTKFDALGLKRILDAMR